MFAWLVGFGAGEQGFCADVGAMEDSDCVGQLGVFGWFAAFGDGDVDFVDVFGLTETHEGFGSVWRLEDGWAFP